MGYNLKERKSPNHHSAKKPISSESASLILTSLLFLEVLSVFAGLFFIRVVPLNPLLIKCQIKEKISIPTIAESQ